MNSLLSGTRARALLVTLLTAAVGITGLGAMPAATAAPQASISGTVTNADGDGIGGITVTTYDADTGDFGDEATTKNDGSYTLKKLGAGSYQIEFFDGDFVYTSEWYDDHRDFADADPVPVAAGQAVTGIDAELTRTGTISGTVTDENGDPIEGAFVDLYTTDEDGFPMDAGVGGSTNASGRYLFPGVPDGEYIVNFLDLDGAYVPEWYDDHLEFFDADHVTVSPGGVSSGIDAELATAGRISGTVTDAEGNPLGDIRIGLGREVTSGDFFSYGEQFNFHTEADGTYDIGGLPAGTWHVCFEDDSGNFLDECYDDIAPREGGTDLTVTAGQTTPDIDASLARAAHVTGTVTDDAGQPVEGIFVALRHLEDGNWSYFGEAETAADGTYRLDGLIPDTNYRVSFESQGEFATEYWDDSLTIDDATPVTLTNGQTLSDVDAELADAAHITGRAADENGNPYFLTAVNAWRWNGTTWEDYQLSFAGEDDNRPNDPTAYDIGGLAPGTYRLEFTGLDEFTDDQGHSGLIFASHEFWNDQPSLELGQDIVVTGASQVLTGYDALLTRGEYPDPVENLTPPTISGTPAVGQTLSASTGTWNPKATTFHYQWFAGTTPVGGDSPTYVPVTADVGKAITVLVVASVPGLGSGAATSAATAAVTASATTSPPPPSTKKQVVNLEKPVIKGSLEVGRKARVTTGKWSPAGVSLAYKWFVGGKRIATADKRKVTLKQKWVGKRLKVVVVAAAAGYLTTNVATQRSSKIKP